MAEIAVEHLTKRFGALAALEDLSFAVDKGKVVGFLGPNGAGKTTTLRVLLGLTSPTSGRATLGGRPYTAIPEPARYVGAVMEASGFHPGRSAANHLRAVAVAAGVAPARVGEVLSLVGLAEFAKRRARALSFGMRQRLALATALLGQPSVLLLDEPANGLDPEAINWLRGFLRSFADGGGTVLVSSHVLAEVAQLVDEVVIVAKGRLVVQTSLAALGERGTRAVRVRTPQARALQAALADQGLPAEVQGTDQVVARGVPPERVGHLAAESGIVIYAMASEGASLEETFLALTGEAE